MDRRVRWIALALTAVALSGCYHAVVTTGLRPDPGKVIDRPWAHSFLGGLVPPSAVDVQQQCGAVGVAKVETQHSFVNMLAAFVTSGIYSPIQITVTCAAPGSADDGSAKEGRAPRERTIDVSEGADSARLQQALEAAAQEAVAAGDPVFVRFPRTR